MTTSSNSLHQKLEIFRSTHQPIQFGYAGENWQYYRSGKGKEVMLLLTGVLGKGEFAFEQIMDLASDFRVLSPDYPPTQTLQQLSEGIIALLNQERVNEVQIIAGSFGGMVAQYLIRQHPGRIKNLILSHTAAPQSMANRSYLIPLLSILPESTVRRLFKIQLKGSFEKAGSFWQTYFNELIAMLSKKAMLSRIRLTNEFSKLIHYSEGDLTQWAGQLVILEADDDPLFPLESRKKLHALYPQASVHTFKGTGHAIAILNPELYTAALRKFLFI